MKNIDSSKIKDAGKKIKIAIYFTITIIVIYFVFTSDPQILIDYSGLFKFIMTSCGLVILYLFYSAADDLINSEIPDIEDLKKIYDLD